MIRESVYHNDNRRKFESMSEYCNKPIVADMKIKKCTFEKSENKQK